MSAEPDGDFDEGKKLSAEDWAKWALTGSDTGVVPANFKDLKGAIIIALIAHARSYAKAQYELRERESTDQLNQIRKLKLELGVARVTADGLQAEVDRLKRGELTDEEFQNLCHNLHFKKQNCDFAKFAKGCVDFQAELFGLGRRDAAPEKPGESVWCPECQGWGRVLKAGISRGRLISYGDTVDCPKCGGKGKVPA